VVCSSTGVPPSIHGWKWSGLYALSGGTTPPYRILTDMALRESSSLGRYQLYKNSPAKRLESEDICLKDPRSYRLYLIVTVVVEDLDGVPRSVDTIVITSICVYFQLGSPVVIVVGRAHVPLARVPKRELMMVYDPRPSGSLATIFPMVIGHRSLRAR
jgi:hypothetical protein